MYSQLQSTKIYKKNPDFTKKSSKLETLAQEHTHDVQTQKSPKPKLDPYISDL